ncbi:pyridoxal phosphate-dependent decarboxylase family protein [Sediminicola luteus]|uniref:Pyridoxal-dependent decarboxylase n=1 Tax=Sediminicola luteus TaxID=319238 RepID=A0A2A4GFZ1_9FLAO|nr:aminotransferase class I/II-fold pyridoxal phosphate-dependent enzyme [Sediminicola luteus]PCE66685.1 pyridoxal-dependent decarboxylase [Sediminicola luteus]
MKKSLDLSHQEFKSFLEQVNQLVLGQYAELHQQKGFHDHAPKTVASWFDEPLPEDPMDLQALLTEVQNKVFAPATGNMGPNMYAYVMAGGNQMGTVAEFLAATINQNNTKWHLAPSMTEIEKRVVQWIGKAIGYSDTAAGVMVSGGSGANLTGLNVARNVFLAEQNMAQSGLFGLNPITVYGSTETHNSVEKSLVVLGIGTDNYRKIPTSVDFKIRLDLLEQAIQKDLEAGFSPFCIIGNAGTVNTGAIDDLEALAQLAKKYRMWFHVDGAYGGVAAALESVKPHYNGLEKADSVALDFHKWLYQPYEIGCTLVKDWGQLKRTFFQKADYLDTALQDTSERLEINEHYFQLSRNAKAFKVWMSIKAYGFGAIKAMIQKDIDLTRYLAQQVRLADDYELVATDVLGVACFRYSPQDMDDDKITALNQQLIPALETDGRVFITGTKLHGVFVLRACIINHRKQQSDIDYLLEVIRELGSKMITHG